MYSLTARLVAAHTAYKKGSKRITMLNSIKYELDISDLMDWFVYFGFSEISKNKLFDCMHENDFIVDIGANLGEITLNSAKITGENGRVYSFEPGKNNFKKLQRNVSLNNHKNISVYNCAIGDRIGFGNEFVRDEFNSGMNTVDFSSEKGEFTVITLDHFIEANKIEKLNLIKIDTEGFEQKVLAGGENTIKKFKPVLFIEIDDKYLKRNNTSPVELLNNIKRLGYDYINAETGKIPDGNFQFENCHFDVLAFPITT